ncbi:MAG: trimethylamine methyltransferase family protein [Proteobacteria bacterium]|nr:trimethylamine methyltransferase family protein [Pseudomonadota bacterium]MBU1584853.1 trimethylamine methyltransferase family protein [Pseudomonadota bacterium]MBU2453754.1 trimethylamine methyltransferase family protein [Pseudomonadota bacterium]MBU2630051.1 trimethylamine methyltransferase family protein [Pseudomonadota bacterium]
MTQRNLKAGTTAVSGFGLKVFSEDQLDTLHFATLQVLHHTGIKVESKEAVKIFQAAGAMIEEMPNYSIVRFPTSLIEDCLSWAPETTTYYGRDPEKDYVMEPGRVGFSTFGECVQVIDPDTRQIRATRHDDLKNATRLCDYLDEINVVERAMGSLDKASDLQAVYNYAAMVENTGKHVLLGFNSKENAKQIIEIAKICSGGEKNFNKRPIVTAFVCPLSPLALAQTCCDVTIECAMQGLGIAIIPMSLAGATATATLAGQLVTHNAEVLSTLVLAQLVRKGTPCTFASCSTILDMRFASPAVGAPEYGIIGAGLTKLAQYYKLPVWVGGGHSDSKLPDAQAAYEATLTATTSALAGANIVYGAGCLEQGLTFDFAKLVMDAEMIRGIHKTIKGIEINDETLALDIIHEVGPGGQFLSNKHTFDHMRELSQGKLFDRRNRESWMNELKGKDLTQRAYEAAAKIVAEHKPMPLPEGALEKMKLLLQKYETKLKNK